MPSAATSYYPADVISIMEDLLARVHTLEQSGGYVNTSTNNFPGGITVGVPPTTINNTPPSSLSGLALSWNAYYNSISIDVSWTLPTDATVYDVEVFWALKTGSTYGTEKSAISGGNTYRIAQAQPNTTYGVRVVGRSNIGIPGAYLPAQPSPPNYTDVTTGADTTIPGTLTGLVLSAGADSLVITFNESTDPDVINGAGYYQIQVADSSSFTSIIAEQRTDAIVVAFNNIQSPQTLWVRVRAIDSSGNAGPWTSAGGGTYGGVSGYDILVGTIGAARIIAGTITANLIAANTITGGNIAGNTITATNLAALQLVVGQYVRSTSYTAGTAGWNIAADGTAEFNNVVVRGTVDSSNITATSIQGGTVTGTVIQSASSAPLVQLTTNATNATFYAHVGGLTWNGTTGLINFFTGASNDDGHAAFMTAYKITDSINGLQHSSLFLGSGGGGAISTGSGGVASRNYSSIAVEPNGIWITGGASNTYGVRGGVQINSQNTTIVDNGGGTFTVYPLAEFVYNVNVDGNLHALGSIAGDTTITATGNLVTSADVSCTAGHVLVGPYGSYYGWVSGAQELGVYNPSSGNASHLVDFSCNTLHTNSDGRFKQIIGLLTSSDDFMKLRPVSYQKLDEQDTTVYGGLVAQEVASVYPHLVYEHRLARTARVVEDTKPSGPDVTYTLDYLGLIPVLVAEVQELRRQVYLLLGDKISP